MKTKKKARILLAKAGLDTHVRGISILMVRLRDAGMEVIYPGLFQTPESIVTAAIQENVDFIFLSSHLAGHLALSKRIMELLKEKGATDIPLCVGGVVPPQDVADLKAIGVKEVFPPHSLPSKVIEFITAELKLEQNA